MMVPVVAMVMAPAAAQAYAGCFNCSATLGQKRSAGKIPQFSISNPTFSNSTVGCNNNLTGVATTSIGTSCEAPAARLSITPNITNQANPFLP